MISDYVKITRPDHWFKNVFVLPGVFFALLTRGTGLEITDALLVLYGLVVICLTASSNYVINEIVDGKFDKNHPKKKDRPIPSGRIKIFRAYVLWLVLMVVSLALASTINKNFFIASIVFLIQGIVYNIPPIRTKDIPYLDVITESVNNPVRLVLGWLLIQPGSLPTLSLMFAYWMIGAFFMASKRYSEYNMINDSARAEAYRSSFRHYSSNKLLISMFYYTSLFSFFMGIFLIRYRIELIVSIPVIALVIAHYLRMSLWHDSPVQAPESLYKEKFFMFLVLSCVTIIFLLFLVDIPYIREFFAPAETYPPQ